MQLALHRLRQQHHEAPPQRHVVPLSPPVEHTQVLTGIAASTEIDLVRCRFRPRAFLLLP
jgi:hypothetical protein